MNNSIAHQSFNEVPEPKNDNALKLPDRNGIQCLTGVSAYVDRVLSGYDDDQREWGLNRVTAKERIGNYLKAVISIEFPYDGAAAAIKVTGHDAAKPTEQEELAIQAELARYNWPHLIPFPSGASVPLPSGKAEVEDRNDFFDVRGQLIMVEYRLKGKVGFPCVTNWDDGRTRWIRPVRGNPLFGLEKLKPDTATVIVSEGSKAAKRGAQIADGKEPNHPWAVELGGGAVHLGWTGGAFSAAGTDWTPIDKSDMTIYVVSDNDEVGRNAITEIAKQLHRAKVFAIEFDQAKWPSGFDLGNDFPEALWEEYEDASGKLRKRYIGPSFHELVAPATFMTTEKTVKDGKGKDKKVWYVRPQWLSQWRYSATDDQYLNIHNPRIAYKAAILNKIMQPFQHRGSLPASTYINGGNLTNQVGMFEYRPDQNFRSPQEREWGARSDRRFNTFVPTQIKPVKGDTSIFHEYLSHVFQDKSERRGVLRWIYTLAAKPQTKMRYGMLLVSNETGTGKSTLLTEIAVPLVGVHNTSQPSSTEIQGNFNDWLSNRRLVVVDECYLGGRGQHEFSNRLKSVVTQEQIWVNPKGLPGKTVFNAAHMALSSNALMTALDIDQKDRRWFIPTVNEIRWPDESFQALYSWLKRGGLSALLYESQNLSEVPGYDDLTYVTAIEKAPMTDRKQEIIEDSRTESQRYVLSIADLVEPVFDDKGQLVERAEMACFPVSFVQDAMSAKFDRDLYSFEKAASFVPRLMKSRGWVYTGKNEKGDGTFDGWQPTENKRKLNLLVSPALAEVVAKEKTIDAIRPHLKASKAAFASWVRDKSGDWPL